MNDLQFLKTKTIGWYVVLAVALAIYIPNLSVRPVNIMEARNFITAREMLTDNHWLLTTMNGFPRYQKPPLPTWLTAVSGALFGIDSVWALRLPAALITIMGLFFVYRFTLRLSDGNVVLSVSSSLVVATSFYVIFAGRNGQWDIYTHAFMLGALYYLFQWLQSDHHTWRNAIGCGIGIGCSFMSKGPVSMFALMLPFLIAYGCTYGKGTGVVLKKQAGSLVILFSIAIGLSAWWPLYVSYYDSQTLEAIANKETTSWVVRNVRPFYYYWSFFIQSGMWTLLALPAITYPYMKTRVSLPKEYRFAILWTLCSVLLLSLVPEKKSRYLLPVLFPLGIVIAFYLEYMFKTFPIKGKRIEKIPLYIHFGILSAIGILFPLSYYLKPILFQEQPYLWSLFSIFLLLSAGSMLYALIKKRIQLAFISSIGFILFCVCFGIPLAKPLFFTETYEDLTPMVAYSKKYELPIYALYTPTPEIVWKYGKKIPVFDVHYRDEDRIILLVQKDIEEETIQREIRFKDIQQVGHIDLNSPGNRDRLRYKWFICSLK